MLQQAMYMTYGKKNPREWYGAEEGDIVLEVTTDGPNQNIRINKYFNVANYTIDWGDGTSITATTNDHSKTYSSAGTYYIILKNPSGSDRRKFGSGLSALVFKSGFTGSDVKVVYMPPLKGRFGDGDSSVGNDFFRSFNANGALTSLPEGSFDISNITEVGDSFFRFFNSGGALTSLPEGSFDISNITSAGNDFFRSFNDNGALTSLPEGSFDISNITEVGDNFFRFFNDNGGALTSLPVGSFDTSNITSAGNSFFHLFNANGGALTSLPVGSFDTSNITSAGNDFFRSFNQSSGALTSLPVGSFDTSNITSAGNNFFYRFNRFGRLTKDTSGIKIYNAGSSIIEFYYSPGNTSESISPGNYSSGYAVS